MSKKKMERNASMFSNQNEVTHTYRQTEKKIHTRFVLRIAFFFFAPRAC